MGFNLDLQECVCGGGGERMLFVKYIAGTHTHTNKQTQKFLSLSCDIKTEKLLQNNTFQQMYIRNTNSWLYS